MKTSYQRELKRNYLIVEMEKSDTRGEPPFEQKMLEQNQIDGILRFQVRQKDEEIRFFYEITSKQPLSRLLEGQTIQAEQIRALILGIARSLDHMEQYLISEKSVLLNPEYLYATVFEGSPEEGSGKPESLAVPGAGTGMRFPGRLQPSSGVPSWQGGPPG